MNPVPELAPPLKQLRLSGILDSLEARNRQAIEGKLAYTEFLSLLISIAELKAIGRHLNQIARALNQDGRTTGPGRQEVQAMFKVAAGLRDHFKALLEANERSWRTDAEKTH